MHDCVKCTIPALTRLTARSLLTGCACAWCRGVPRAHHALRPEHAL